MPPAAAKFVRADTSPNMTSSGEPPRDYYKAGSSEIVTETKLTVSRLETVGGHNSFGIFGWWCSFSLTKILFFHLGALVMTITQRRKLTKTSDRLVIVLVGLPARGKSFISRKLLHYVNWTGVRCKAFNVGKYRREAYAQVQASSNPEAAATQESTAAGACDANFFSAENEQAAALRQQVAQLALDDMLAWLDDEDDDYWDEAPMIDMSRHSFTSATRSVRHHAVVQKVAIFDATNSTEQRRQWVLEQCTSPDKRGDKKTGVVFVESVCTDQELLEENYRFKISNSPDYKDMTIEEGMADLLKRVKNYEAQVRWCCWVGSGVGW